MVLSPAGFAAPQDERVGAIDALRGVALCGILLVNIVGGSSIEIDHPLRSPLGAPADWDLWWAQSVYVEGAMRGLFTLLFGGSFLLFMAKADRGAPEGEVRRLFLRRLFWLFMFGVIDNTLLLWPGDILVIYAPAGLILLPVWRWPARRLLVLAAVLLMAVSAGSVLRSQRPLAAAARGPALEAAARHGERLSSADAKTLKRWREMRQGVHEDPKATATERRARLGGYGANLAFMTRTAIDWTLDWSTLWWIGDAAALFVLGMALFKTGVLQGDASPWLYVALVAAGYGLGLPIRAWQSGLEWRAALGGFAPEPWQVWAPAVLSQWSRTLVTLGHLGLFHVLWRIAPMLFAPFKALGRMALTGYLGQSALAALAFSGFGLGLWGRLTWPGLLATAVAIMAIELVASAVWLTFFRMGPLEWIWRTLTYGKAPALLRSAPLAEAPGAPS